MEIYVYMYIVGYVCMYVLPAPHDRFHNRREVVVENDNVRSFLGHYQDTVTDDDKEC